jgi:hypothetical protein
MLFTAKPTKTMALVHIAGKLKFGAERKGKKGKKRI